MRKSKSIEVYTVRNASGQFMGMYRAKTAEQAIERFVRDQNIHQAQFRNTSVVEASDVTAAVEKEALS